MSEEKSKTKEDVYRQIAEHLRKEQEEREAAVKAESEASTTEKVAEET